MNLRKLIFTKNRCYIEGKKITPKGIMVHSTGKNNPALKRYVNPDDGLLGKNQYGNHWNRSFYPGKCTPAFIGKLADGSIATYQVLPWDHRGWHSASGKKGSANNTHISFEICEDNLKDATYFKKVYQEAVELCVYLCKMYHLTEKTIIDHREGHIAGIASNHGDVAHWFSKHGKTMDDFRADVKKLLNPTATTDKTDSVEKLKATDKAQGYSANLSGTYTVTASALNIRHGAGTGKSIMVTIPKGTKVQCYGYYTNRLGVKWYYVAFTYRNVYYEGFASSVYLRK